MQIAMKQLLVGGLCLCTTTSVWAQTKPAKTGGKKATLAKFSLSTAPNGSFGSTQTAGNAGLYTPVRNINRYIPIGERSPDQKKFYVTLFAQITLPSYVTPPAQIKVRAKRIKFPDGIMNGGTPISTGETEQLTLMLVKSTKTDVLLLPQLASGDRTIWTYRLHDKSNQEEGLTPDAREWNITAKKGRWLLNIDPQSGASNAVNYKINKRQQIVIYARDWASMGLTTDSYTRPGENRFLFNACGGFTDHVYQHLGLRSVDLNVSDTVDDQGVGSLGFYYGRGNPSPTGRPNASHVAILDGNSRIDNNCTLMEEPPTVRGLGDQTSNLPAWAPTSTPYWGTIVKGAPKSTANPRISILQELDVE